MAAVQLVDFSDIYSAVLEELKIPSSDTTTLDRVKRNINIAYHQVATHTEWPWLMKRTDIVHRKYHAEGTSDTASVTNDSTTVTLSSAPDSGLGSFVGYFLKIEGGSVVYTVASHTAGSASLTLSAAYQGTTNATAGFKIWTDRLNLPTDARLVTTITHDRSSREVLPIGLQKFDELSQVNRALTDTPKYFALDDFYDPSTGDAETETDRYRRVRIYPAVYDEGQIMHVTYIQEVDELDADGDEPAIPLEDRIVLVYGALALSWSRDRDPEAAGMNERKFMQKLSAMAARLTQERPRLEIDPSYMYLRRNNYRSPSGE